MNIESLRNYCLSLKGTSEEFPFDSNTLVFKVGGKIFLLTSLDAEELQFNVKCDPEIAVQLREQYDTVLPGYHMNKKHWNTIIANGSISDTQLKEWISNSYQLVIDSLPKKIKEELA